MTPLDLAVQKNHSSVVEFLKAVGKITDISSVLLHLMFISCSLCVCVRVCVCMHVRVLGVFDSI